MNNYPSFQVDLKILMEYKYKLMKLLNMSIEDINKMPFYEFEQYIDMIKSLR